MSRAMLALGVLAASCAAQEDAAPSAEVLARFRDVDWNANRYMLESEKADQVHIAYAGQSAEGYPTGVNVAWVHSDKKNCHVKYGLVSENYTMSTDDAHSHRYLDTGAHHYNIDILDLTPSTKYYYEVDCQGKKTKEFSFTTAANSRDLGKPFTINIFGDMGWLGSSERPMIVDLDGLEKNWSAVPVHNLQMDMMAAGEIDMMWIVGDIGYADDAFAHDVVGGLYEKCMDGFVNWQEPLAANLPYHVSVGNHEAECHSPECVLDPVLGKNLANFSAYNARWHMPSKSSSGVLNMWYSWNVGPVHFISLNTETDFEGAGEETKGAKYKAGGFGADGEYLAWVEADLKQAYADKKSGKRPFIVVGGHRHCKKGCQPKVLQSLFDRYEVDLFVAGHAHAYARSVKSCLEPVCRPEYNVTFDTTYVYSGASGSDETEYVATGPTYNSSEGGFQTTELSTGFLTIFNSSALRWRLVSAFNERRTIDDFWLTAQ